MSSELEKVTLACRILAEVTDRLQARIDAIELDFKNYSEAVAEVADEDMFSKIQAEYELRRQL